MGSNLGSGAYWHISYRSILAVAAGCLFALNTPAYPQESAVPQHVQNRATRQSSAGKGGKQTKQTDSASCTPKLNDAGTVSKADKNVLRASESQEKTDERSTADASTATLSVAVPSRNEWLKDQLRDEQADTAQAPHSAEPVNSGIGSDRQCKPEEGSLKIEPVSPN